MNYQLAPSKDLSLQHVLENGLAIIQSRQVEAIKRNQVLGNLIDILAQANRGSQALHSQNLLFAVEQRPAFERFTLFFRYLNQTFGDELLDRLNEASSVLAALQENREPNARARARAEEFINCFLTALDRERSLTPLAAPKAFVSLS